MNEMTTRQSQVKRILIAVIIYAVNSSVSAQDLDLCSDVLKHGLFDIDETKESLKDDANFRDWQCSSSFKSHQEALDSGLNIGVVIYGVPLKIGGSWNEAKVSQWKNENCSASSRQMNFATATYRLIRSASPSLLSAWSTCMSNHYAATALQCRFSSQGKKFVFSANWRRTTGEAQSAAPIISEWKVAGGECDPELDVGSRVLEASRQSICTQADNNDLVVLLETSRGSCFQSSSSLIVPYVISGKLKLSNPLHIRESVVQFSSGATIVTNGNDLTINALRELAIEGAPKIISFEGRAGRPTGDTGRDAGSIIIQGTKITGTVLNIDNFGEDGAHGGQGSKGPRGPNGQNGKGGVWKDLKGCVGRRNANNGGAGGKGNRGQSGGNAGNGGSVTVAFGQGLQEGVISRVSIVKQRRNPYTNTTYTCQGSCPGVPGNGGSGGPGGDGGSGGLRGKGRGQCGDGKPGSGGPTGLNGGVGAKGSEGKSGTISVVDLS